MKVKTFTFLTISAVAVLLASLFFVGNAGSKYETTEGSGIYNGILYTDTCLTVILDETEDSGYTGETLLRASNTVDGIGNKNVAFIGGGVSGGITWSTIWTSDLGKLMNPSGGGGCSGNGRVEVHGSAGLLAQFALPLNAVLTVNNVNKIVIFAEAPLPSQFSSGEGFGWQDTHFAAYVVASVYWVTF